MSIKQLDDASQAYKKFLDKMVEVDKKYGTSYNQPKINAPESLGLKKLAYDMPTEEEVAAAAQKYYEGDKARDVANVGANTDKSVNNLSGKAEQAKAVAVKSIADAEQKRQDDLKSANYATQAKNLVDSSIRTGVFEEINDDADQKITNAATTRDETIAEIDKEISRLNDLKLQKIKDIENEYAKRAESKAKSLMDEERQKADAVTKYNNSVEEKEAQYKKNLAKQLDAKERDEWQRVADMLNLTAKLGESGVARQKEEEKYREARNILDNFSPSDALAILESSAAFATHLGSMYDTLRAYYTNKASEQRGD